MTSGTIRIVEYQGFVLARVKITDSAAAFPKVKEMVEFWGSWEQRLKAGRAFEHYLDVWLADLGLFILNNFRLPHGGDEGWYPFPLVGLELLAWDCYTVSAEDITIR